MEKITCKIKTVLVSASVHIVKMLQNFWTLSLLEITAPFLYLFASLFF